MKNEHGAAFGAALGLIIFGLVMIFMNQTEPTPSEPHNLPACIEEDGSTQEECMWDDGSGLIVHNWDWGKHYSTYART